MQLGGLGERCKLLQQGVGCIWCILALKSDNVNVNVNVNVEFEVTLHEQVRYMGTRQY